MMRSQLHSIKFHFGLESITPLARGQSGKRPTQIGASYIIVRKAGLNCKIIMEIVSIHHCICQLCILTLYNLPWWETVLTEILKEDTLIHSEKKFVEWLQVAELPPLWLMKCYHPWPAAAEDTLLLSTKRAIYFNVQICTIKSLCHSEAAKRRWIFWAPLLFLTTHTHTHAKANRETILISV